MHAQRFLIVIVLALVASAAAGETHPFDARDLVTMSRLSDPRVSPDGEQVAFVLRTTDLEADAGRTDLWLASVRGDGEPRQLTTHPAADNSPRWSPDGASLYFLSTRSGSSQVWQLPVNGGEARQVTDLALDAGNLVVSPDGRHLAFSVEVFVDCGDLACTAERLAQRAASKRSGALYDQLFVRHWDSWKDGRRSHLFVMPAAGDPAAGDPAAGGAAVDVTAGMDADVPSKPFGGGEEIAFTPDGEGVVFTARTAGAAEPWSTDFNLWVAPLAGGAPRPLTDNPAWDTQPVFSPDGKTLAYKAMSRPAYESDRFRIVLRPWPAGAERVLAEDWDRSAGDLVFSHDGRTLFVTAQDDGQASLFAVGVATGRVERVAVPGSVHSPAPAGDRLVFGLDDMKSPVDLYTLNAGALEKITDVNRERLAALRFGDFERFSFAGWNGETVSGWLVKPVDFDPARKYPIAFLIHGGPQGSWSNHFHYRWNPQVYAGAGYAAILIDFHGSTGYGQAFTDAIAGDWGGKPLEDLQKGLAAARERYPWLDGGRACALGASYGGYMINWIAGHWQAFQCLVNHDGIFDVRAAYYSTEELWFPEWEFQGTPWQSPETYDRFNPARFADRWRTPMLVIHGERDYRLPVTQGLQAFTALQRQGIASQFLYFPDENHWVLRPNNSLQWHETVLAWLARWLGTP